MLEGRASRRPSGRPSGCPFGPPVAGTRRWWMSVSASRNFPGVRNVVRVPRHHGSRTHTANAHPVRAPRTAPHDNGTARPGPAHPRPARCLPAKETGVNPAVRALARAAMAARPVPLADVQARAELLARFDRRYLVPVEVFAAFAAELTDRRRPGGPFAALCINGRRWFRYRSVHYDTPDLRLFHDHRQGRRLRYTIRERLYEDTGERQFEIKLTGRRGETVKHRQPLLPGDPGPRRGPARLPRLRTGPHLRHRGPRRPGPRAVETEYHRATFVADGQRITCDAALLCRDPATGRTVRADGGLVLVETRTAGRLTEADRLLHGYRRAGRRVRQVLRRPVGAAPGPDRRPLAPSRTDGVPGRLTAVAAVAGRRRIPQAPDGSPAAAGRASRGLPAVPGHPSPGPAPWSFLQPVDSLSVRVVSAIHSVGTGRRTVIPRLRSVRRAHPPADPSDPIRGTDRDPDASRCLCRRPGRRRRREGRRPRARLPLLVRAGADRPAADRRRRGLVLLGLRRQPLPRLLLAAGQHQHRPPAPQGRRGDPGAGRRSCAPSRPASPWTSGPRPRGWSPSAPPATSTRSSSPTAARRPSRTRSAWPGCTPAAPRCSPPTARTTAPPPPRST